LTRSESRPKSSCTTRSPITTSLVRSQFHFLLLSKKLKFSLQPTTTLRPWLTLVPLRSSMIDLLTSMNNLRLNISTLEIELKTSFKQFSQKRTLSIKTSILKELELTSPNLSLLLSKVSQQSIICSFWRQRSRIVLLTPLLTAN